MRTVAPRIHDRDNGPAGWEHQAACREYDPNLWFPISYDSPAGQFSARVARDICEIDCPVREFCLATALDREGGKNADSREGIWGGLTPRERYNLTRHGRPNLRQRAAA